MFISLGRALGIYIPTLKARQKLIPLDEKLLGSTSKARVKEPLTASREARADAKARTRATERLQAAQDIVAQHLRVQRRHDASNRSLSRTVTHKNESE